MTAIWCYAYAGNEELMQVTFAADFSHDDPVQTITIIDAYAEGTRPYLNFPVSQRLAVKPPELVSTNPHMMVLVKPVVGTEGKPWTGRIIFIDQRHRLYESEKFEFKYEEKRQAVSAATVSAPGPPSTM